MALLYMAHFLFFTSQTSLQVFTSTEHQGTKDTNTSSSILQCSGWSEPLIQMNLTIECISSSHKKICFNFSSLSIYLMVM